MARTAECVVPGNDRIPGNDRRGRPPARRRSVRLRRALRLAARAVVACASTATLVATGLGWTVAQQLDAGLVTSDAVTESTGPGEAFTALLVGLDARTDAAGNPLPQAVLDELHSGPDEGQLHTDTIIVLHVPAEPGAAAVAISIPRDSFVPIAGGRGTHKINSAYGRGLQDAEETLMARGVGGETWTGGDGRRAAARSSPRSRP